MASTMMASKSSKSRPMTGAPPSMTSTASSAASRNGNTIQNRYLKTKAPQGGQSAPPPKAAAAPPAAAARKKSVTITPPGKKQMTDLDLRMTVDKGIVDELLLICGVIGTTTEGGELLPVTDCLNWLQDLQRALRRDDDLYRPISLLIGKWRVVPQKLLPLIMTCRYDTPIVLTVVKILVILTKPLADNTKRAGCVIIDTHNKKTTEDVIREQIRLRDNALEQAELLMEYKRAVVHHSSHHHYKHEERHHAQMMDGNGGGSTMKQQGSSASSKDGTGLLSVLVSLLAEPLSKSGTARTETDHLTIELVLHLVRNLLSAEPLLMTSGDTSSQHAQLHQELVTLFDRELVFEIILVLGQDMELRENAQYNLLVMEILHHLLKSQDPTAVARSILKRDGNRSSGSNGHDKEKSRTATSGSGALSSSSSASINPQKLFRTGLLSDKLKQEKSKLHALAGPRHAHFGGTWMTQRGDGKRSYVGATEEQQQQRQSGHRSSLSSSSATITKRKNRKAEPFIGATTKHNALFDEGPATKRSQAALNSFCQRFVEHCYGPVMKSLKNEFRRDSVRLEEGDKVVFFRIVWFFCQWWRIHDKLTKSNSKSSKDSGTTALPLGKLIFTMDVFTFNLVLNATDSFQQHKKYARLAQAVALFSEMMYLLQDMYHSKESTEHLMALGLMDRLFYGSDPLDRLPKLVKLWIPATTTRDYLADLCEVLHVSLKLLDTNAKACGGDDTLPQDNRKKRSSKKSTKDAATAPSDAVAKMKDAAAEFNVATYFAKKLVSNNMVFMFTHLLSQYAANPAHVNHHVVALFLRLSRVEVVSASDDEHHNSNNNNEAFSSDPLLAIKKVTLEPMLYNIQLFMVLEKILNDSSLRKKEKEHASLLAFGTNLMHKFAQAATTNPMLYVECLFRHNPFHKFCEMSTHLYVNEELRMIAERELLLEEHRRSLEEGGEGGDGDYEDNDDEDNDGELEFQDDGDVVDATLTGPLASKRKRSKASKGKESPRLSSDSESDNDDPPASKTGPPQAKSSRNMTIEDDSDDSDQETTPASSSEPATSKRSLDEEEDPASSDQDESPAASKRQKRVLLQKRSTKNDDDGGQSSDDEMEFGGPVDTPSTSSKAEGEEKTSSTATAKSKSRLVIEDDEEEDEN